MYKSLGKKWDRKSWGRLIFLGFNLFWSETLLKNISLGNLWTKSFIGPQNFVVEIFEREQIFFC